MDQKELLNNIIHDLLYDALPSVGCKSASIIINEKKIPSIKKICKYSIKSASEVVMNNVIDYSLNNYYENDITFGMKLVIRFGASAGSRFISNLIFKRKKNAKLVLLDPFIEGMYMSSLFLISNHNQASRYFRAYHPHIYYGFKRTLSICHLDYLANQLMEQFDDE